MRRIILFTSVLCCSFLYCQQMVPLSQKQKINDVFTKMTLSDKQKPRLLTAADIPSNLKKDFKQYKYTFALEGDFNKDGYLDFALIGKYQKPKNPDTPIFMVILTEMKKEMTIQYQTSFHRKIAYFFRETILTKNAYDAIVVGFDESKDDVIMITWVDNQYVYCYGTECADFLP